MPADGVAWKVFYDDGATFSSADGEPHEAPARGVQVIGQADPLVGRRLLTRGYYWYDYDDDRWYGGDIFGLFDYLARPGHKTVKFGRTIPRADWEAVKQAANDDPDLPDKSAWDRTEPNPDLNHAIDRSRDL